MKIYRLGLYLTLLALFSATGEASPAAGILRGKVVDPTGAPVVGAVVTLTNPVSGYQATERTHDQGEFLIPNVPFNPYVLKVEMVGFATYIQQLDIRSSVPLDLDIKLSIGSVSESVTVVAENPGAILETDSTGSHFDIDKSTVNHFPATATNRGIEAILLATPGFIADENGRFHFRGSHGQITYVVDGVPIGDQIHVTFSNSLDPRNVESMEVITGNIPAEYGGKAAAVVNLNTKTGLGSDRPFFGNVLIGGASFDTGELGLQFGGGGHRFGYFASLGGSKSNRFLDPPNFENLHNGGNTERWSGRFDYTPNGTRDFFHFTYALGRSFHQVPNLLSQHAARQDQRIDLHDLFLSVQWLHAFNPNLTFDVTPSYRTSVSQLFNSPGDTPLTTTQARHLSNYGFSTNFSYTKSTNHFKTGVQVYGVPLSENFAFGITDPDFNRPPREGGGPGFNPSLLPYDLTRGGRFFNFGSNLTGKTAAWYASDTVTVKGFTANLGVRYDHYRFLVRENVVEPRIGLAYYIKQTGTVLRASYDRLYITPENENLLLASSPVSASLAPPEVRMVIGTGFRLIKGERQHSYELGVQQRVKDYLRLDAVYWTKDSKNAADNSQFLNTGILFPISSTGAKLKGFDLRVDVPNHHGFTGYWSFGTSKAIFIPPTIGGLFLDAGVIDSLNAGPFRIDHDQKFSSQWGGRYYNQRAGWWTAVTGRYDSGLVTEVEDPEEIAANPDLAFGLEFVDINQDPQRVRPRTIWNLSVGLDLLRERRHKTEFQFDVLNIGNKRTIYNFLSVFGGTHVFPPRQYAGRIKFNF